MDLREFLETRKFTVLWSGGIDSTASLLWVLDNISHSRFNIIYVEVTGNTHKLCNQYIKELAKELGVSSKLIHTRREDLDFFECLKKWGIPVLGRNRWCLFQFKVRVWDKHSYTVQVTGIRGAESKRRASIFKQVNVFRRWQDPHIVVSPIFSWKRRDVLSYLQKHGVPVNPCYALFGHSGNCMFCPNYRVSQIIRTLNDPEWRGKILEALQSQRGKNVYAVRAWLAKANQLTIDRYF